MCLQLLKQLDEKTNVCCCFIMLSFFCNCDDKMLHVQINFSPPHVLLWKQCQVLCASILVVFSKSNLMLRTCAHNNTLSTCFGLHNPIRMNKINRNILLKWAQHVQWFAGEKKRIRGWIVGSCIGKWLWCMDQARTMHRWPQSCAFVLEHEKLEATGGVCPKRLSLCHA